MVIWNFVLQGFIYGIVLGYMVLYKRERDVNESYLNIISVVIFVQFINFDKFMMYGIKVLVFIIKGNGVMINDIYERIYEDGQYNILYFKCYNIFVYKFFVFICIDEFKNIIFFSIFIKIEY